MQAKKRLDATVCRDGVCAELCHGSAAAVLLRVRWQSIPKGAEHAANRAAEFALPCHLLGCESLGHMAPLTSCRCCQTRILCEHQRSSDTAFVNLGGKAPPARSGLQPLHEICEAGHRPRQPIRNQIRCSCGEKSDRGLLFTVTRGIPIVLGWKFSAQYREASSRQWTCALQALLPPLIPAAVTSFVTCPVRKGPRRWPCFTLAFGEMSIGINGACTALESIVH